MLIDEPALALEVVCLDPGCQTSKNGVLELDGFLLHEFSNKVDCSTLAGEFLHLAIVRHDRGEEVTSRLAHLRTLMRIDQTQQL